MRIVLERDGDVPLYRQVADHLHALIRDGALAPGTRLPTIRQLAQELHLTRLTVHSAYSELQALGLIESVVGRGTFVAATRPPSLAATPSPPAPASRAMPAIPAMPAVWLGRDLLNEAALSSERPGLLSLSHATPAPETYPIRELRRAFGVALSSAEVLGYGYAQGEVAFREQVSRLLLERGLAVSPDLILVTSGAQQAIAVALHALSRPGDVILAEAPTYPRFVELVTRRGQHLVGIPRDAYGLALGALEAACIAYRPRLLYLVPTYHNPTGTSLSAEQRAAVLRLAATYGFLIVEDDIYGFLAHDGPAPPPLKALDRDDAEHVIYLTSFSKALAPGLRLGVLVAAPGVLADLAEAKQSMDLVTSPVAQRALAEYLRRGGFGGHLQRARIVYRERRDALLAALERELADCVWTRPEGGLSLWVTMPDGVNERDLFLEALDRGVGFTRGQAFFAQPQAQPLPQAQSQPTARPSLRLCFGALAPAQLEQAVHLLRDALAVQHRRSSSGSLLASRASSPLV
jgi:DNA-binding transcriptional MocR family regulator